MPETLTVDMCVTIRNGCPIDYLITGDGQAEFAFGGERRGCHYAFDASALQNFIAAAVEALAELQAQVADRSDKERTNGQVASTGRAPA